MTLTSAMRGHPKVQSDLFQAPLRHSMSSAIILTSFVSQPRISLLLITNSFIFHFLFLFVPPPPPSPSPPPPPPLALPFKSYTLRSVTFEVKVNVT
ncbi:hypothetical protein E2C01_059876 [Portunus trituberculatus]|uniref:Uncharacterized protein n=1 Tax=Portunus trituberculatus TaxID=210409 RepID=A0A5B7H0Q5_PORTR|nr:hypothetical protein [Portunus trituberculatus]